MKLNNYISGLIILFSMPMVSDWKLSMFTNNSELTVHSAWRYDTKGEQKQIIVPVRKKINFLEYPVTENGGIGLTLFDKKQQIFYVFCDGHYDSAIAANRVQTKHIKTVITKPNGTYYARAVIKNSAGEQLNTSVLAINSEKESCNLELNNINGQYMVQLEKA